jgi:hypothetical protein
MIIISHTSYHYVTKFFAQYALQSLSTNSTLRCVKLVCWPAFACLSGNIMIEIRAYSSIDRHQSYSCGSGPYCHVSNRIVLHI